MNAITKTIAMALALKFVNATITHIPGEDGGIIVRVTKLADVATAESIATEVTAKFGVEVLVSF